MSDAFPTLFSPWRLGRLDLPNRLVLSAMTTGFGYDEGLPNEDLLAYFRARSRGVGLATVAFGAVRPEGRVEQQIPWMWRDDIAEGLDPLVRAITEGGAAASLQLGHGGRQVSPAVIGQEPVGPSSVPPEVHVSVSPRALTTAEVEGTIEAFGAGAAAAQRAGFSAVEIHAAHGYLIQQFLSAQSNTRADRFGEVRTRFGERVIDAVRTAAPDLAVIVRINGADLVPDGMAADECLEAAITFAAAGADALLVSAGVYGSVPYTIPLVDDPEGCFLPLAARIRRAVDVPVIGVGRITVPETAETALTDGSADAIAIGRALLADPDWVDKARTGDSPAIRPCIATVQGCAGMLQFGEAISCAVNPDVGRERRPPVIVERRVELAVVGGGPAGMEAARRAAELGHHVVLVEREDELGGQLRWAAETPTHAHWRRLIDWYERQLREAGVDVRLGQDRPPPADELIVATGAEPVIPALDGFDAMAAWTGPGAVAGEAGTTGAPLEGRIAVIGHGSRAIATALRLAERHDVVMVGRGRWADDTSGLTRRALRTRLDRAGITLLPGRVTGVAPDRIDLDDGTGLEVTGVVFVEPMGPSPSPVAGPRIGDAVEPRGVVEAIAEGRQAAEAIGISGRAP